jgi:23S rRNA pseudouridine2605 synthase
VEIDRRVVTELGTKVDPLQSEIRVDGVVLHRPKRLYFAVNKPPGVVTTNFDPSGRARVIDLVPTEERVFAVGRLDRASEGLILVTNDGDLANRITHPRYGVEKTYHVRVEGTPSNEQLLRLRRGVRIAEGVARVQSVKVKSRHKNVSDLEIILNEGKNREIRRILAKIGHKVLALKRIAVGPVKLGELKSGSCRKLMPQEIEALREAARERRKESKRKGPPGVKPVGGRREAPAPLPTTATQPSAAPPKIDLATLLNPALAPKHATAITPLPAAASKPIGDVLAYDAPDEASVAPLNTPVRKRRRPLREYETDSEPIAFGEQDTEGTREQRPPVRSRPTRLRGTVGDARPPRGKFGKARPAGRPPRGGTGAPRGERSESGPPRTGRSNRGLPKPPGGKRGPAKFRKRRGR